MRYGAWAVLIAMIAGGCTPTPSEPKSTYRKPPEVVQPQDLPKTPEERDREANPFAPLVVEFELGDGKIEGAVSTTGAPVKKALLEFSAFDAQNRPLQRVRTELANVTREDPVVFNLNAPVGAARVQAITLTPLD